MKKVKNYTHIYNLYLILSYNVNSRPVYHRRISDLDTKTKESNKNAFTKWPTLGCYRELTIFKLQTHHGELNEDLRFNNNGLAK